MSGYHGYAGGYHSDLTEYAVRDFSFRCQRIAESSMGYAAPRRIGGWRLKALRYRKGWCYRCGRGESQCECIPDGGTQ